MFKRIFLLILLSNIYSCNRPEYLKFHNFNNGWIESETLSFEFNGNFETKMADLSFILRHNSDYPFSNIFLIPHNFPLEAWGRMSLLFLMQHNLQSLNIFLSHIF